MLQNLLRSLQKKHKHKGKHDKQQGFTLVEIAIVLVIIGLLLGGVLKGQEIIKSAKIKSAASDINAYSVALMSYEDRYGNLRAGGENFVDTTANSTTPTSEQMLQELADRGLTNFKENHSLGGKIILAKNETSGTETADSSGNGAVNGLAETDVDKVSPKIFSWAICYTDISEPTDAQSLIRIIDGNNADFNGADSAYKTGKARWVGNDLKSAVTSNGTSVCFEI